MGKRYTAALDLGDSTLRLAVATSDDEGVASLVALVERPSQGVKRGQIDNIALVCQTINELLEELQQEYCLKAESLYVGLSGEFIRSARHSDHVFVVSPQSGVSSEDVQALRDRMDNVHPPEGEVIMERFAQNYMVDGVTEVKNPVGSFGRKLSSIYNFVLCQQTPAQRVELALRNCSLHLDGCHSNALTLCEAIATDEERTEGVVVVDVGSEITDVAICQHNVVRYLASIPLGANAINADIKYMVIPERYIEQLKCEFGNAVSDLTDAKRAVRVPGRTPREDKRILLRNLSMAIEARALDIAEFVRSEIRDAGYEGRAPYLVLTGGSAKLTNFDELLHRTTGLDVRVGYPINGFDEMSQMKLAVPDYSTLAGLLIRSISLEPSRVTSLAPQMEETVIIVEEESVESGEDYTPLGAVDIALSLPEPTPTPIAQPQERTQEVPEQSETTQEVPEPEPDKSAQVVDNSTQPSSEKGSDVQPVQSAPSKPSGVSGIDYTDYNYDMDDDEEDVPKRGISKFFKGFVDSINRSFGGEDGEDI